MNTVDPGLYRPTLNTEQDVRDWVASWTAIGGFPHPDDSAVVQKPYTGEDTLGIYGPAFPDDLDLDLARAYDDSKAKALDILDKAGVDIYDLLITEDGHVIGRDEA